MGRLRKRMAEGEAGHGYEEDASLLGEDASLLGKKKQASEEPSKLTDQFLDRKKLRDERGFDVTDRDIGGFMKAAKRMQQEHQFKSKIEKELSYDKMISTKSNRLAALAVLSLIIYIVHMEVNFDTDRRIMNNAGAGSLGMRFLMSAVTAVLLCALFDYHQLNVYMYQRYQCGVADADAVVSIVWPQEQLFQFLLEFAVCIVHPLPGIITNKLGCFMFCRLYLLMMLIRNYSELYVKRGLVYKGGHLKRGGKRIDLALVLKIQVDAYPVQCLFMVFLSLWFLMSYGVYICEREGINGADLSYTRCLYGTSFLFLKGVSQFDSSGSTAGRAIELVVATVGVIAIAIVVALVTELMEVSEAEDFALTWMHRNKQQAKSETFAAELIQAAWRLHQLRVQDPDEVTLEVEFFFKSLLKRHADFRDERSSEENLSLDLTHDKLLSLSRDLTRVVDDIEDIKQAQDDLLETFDIIDDFM